MNRLVGVTKRVCIAKPMARPFCHSFVRNAETKNPKINDFEQKFKASDNENFKDFKEETGDEFEPMEKKEKQRIGWAVALGMFSSYLYLGWGDEYQEDENLIIAHNRRALASIRESYEYFMHPPKKALLPPLPKSLHRDFTLCVELSDALTHLTWQKDIGWYVALRPGAKEFLYSLNKIFEVVIFTDTPAMMAEPVIQALDSIGLTHYRLYREHHRLEGDTHLKDLDFLNRDLSKVVVLENNMNRVRTHPENAFYLKEWEGQGNDTELFKFMDVLQEMLIWSVTTKETDLRPIMQKVRDLDAKDIPHAWELYKAQLVLEEQTFAPSKENEGFYSGLVKSAGSIVKSLVGGDMMNRSTQFGRVSNVAQLEKTSKQLRKNVSEEFKKFEVLEKKLIKEHLEQIEKHKEQLANSEYTLIDYMTGNVPQPGEEAK